MSIRYFNRVTQKVEDEKVFGGTAIDLAYLNPFGKFLTDHVLSKSWVSRAMGAYEDSGLSRKQIGKFVEQYQIDMNLFEPQNYRNFNEFFVRKFREGVRNFDQNDNAFCAGAEARYLAFESITNDRPFFVKGIEIRLGELLDDSTLSQEFDGGTLIIARLCPVDYHRFHFPCSGEITRFRKVSGELHSVNPVALVSKPDIFLKNERHVAVIESPIFGKVAMIEVGALGVGKIVQSANMAMSVDPRSSSKTFVKGQEKGYFLFGGSTVVWVLQKSRLTLSKDLDQNSRQGLETWIPLGDKLGEFKSVR